MDNNKRWKVERWYKTAFDQSVSYTVYIDYIEELSELQEIVEVGPDFTSLGTLSITYNLKP